MKEKSFIWLLGTAISLNLTLPATAYAGGIQVQTGRMTVERSRNGGITIDTGRIQLDSSGNRPRSDRLPYYRSNPSQCRSDRVIRQDSRQINRSGRTSSHTASYSYCRGVGF